ncbi:hypothetical protein Pla175_44770 [Pirellulimonas nuda]|uniref:Lipoprotein n=1 Tax=Pirellulimonas nuda TaxID=2528009 RepID=A0A518DHV4_9BACT|nr:PEP-CTERM sorting domain-containing protein [Pirellulimonas nuda]QDU91060.1 hypothetical protein Pla175_44770 [Pirellulimonas nuda]
MFPPSVRVRCVFVGLVVGACLAGALPGAASAAIVTVGAVPNAPNPTTGAVGGQFIVGQNAYGSVTATGMPISSGGPSVGTVGDGVNGIGVVSLNGFGADWTISGATSDLVIGDEGTGQVSLANAARVIVPDDTVIGAQQFSNGRLTVAGLGSLYDTNDDFSVANAGAGIVEITSGGAVESDAVFVGVSASSQGRITISDDLSRWNATSTAIGVAGNGLLEILNGGRFNASDAVVGSTGTGLVDVVGIGSLWAVNGGVSVGFSGDGTMLIRSGARTTVSGVATVAANVGSVGQLTVDGVGSRLDITGSLSTGQGDAQVAISGGGVVTMTGSLTLGPTGRLTLDGGRVAPNGMSITGVVEGAGVVDAAAVTLSSAGPRGRVRVGDGDHLLFTGTVSNTGFIDLGGGEIELGSTLSNSSDISARNGAVLRLGGSGLVNNANSQLAVTSGVVDVFGLVSNSFGAEIAVVGGSTAVFHDAVTNNGTIFVSASSEIVLLENLSFVPGASFNVELASIDPADDPTEAFGLASVGGAASLGGGLTVSLASGFTPSLGDSYKVLQASGGRSGVFAAESLPVLSGGLAFDVQYTSDSVILAVVAAGTPGDYTGDGFVDAADYTVWRDNLGAAAGSLPNDPNGGVIGVAQYNTWKANFGLPALGAAAGQSVPEPAAAWLLVAAAAGAALRRRR